jgi:peptidoglycan/LPS O-acetylase OafA/YrhL
VFGFHIAAQGFLEDGHAKDTVSQVFAAGSTGVGFFFILSGFVLTWSARPVDSTGAIWRRRAARVVPNHVVAWSIAFAGLLYAGKAGSLRADSPSLVLLQAWIPSERVYFAVNTPAWSLSCELAFYAAFPFLLPIIGRIPVRRLWPAAALVVVGVLLVPVVALGLPDRVAYWFVWIFPGTRVLEFILGMLLARIVRAGLWIRVGLLLPTALAVAGYLAASHLPRGFGFVAATVVPFAVLIAAAAAADVANRPTPWRSAPLVLLGEISFAFYLLHQIVIRGIDQALGDRIWSSDTGLTMTGVMLLVSVAAAWLLHKGVERPMIRLLNRRPGNRSPLATAVK